MEFNNIDTATSYATEENLTKALKRQNLSDYRYMVVCNRQGRFTAIFQHQQFEGDVARAARWGYKTF